jgi:Tol biopolymer transport system component/DNA-binding winged helix-turn-helix (wHTH) protein
MGAQRDRQSVQFGVFELDPASGELRKHGIRIRLQDQPLKLLQCLLETPGEICAREDLIRTIWPTGTFVDYERGLNVAITRLRQALGDSADTPRYVETVGRKGYRFIAPLESASVPEPTGQPGTPVAIPKIKISRAWPYVAVFAIAVAAVAAAGWWRATRSTPQPLARLSVELGRDTILAGPGTLLALSPDGTRLAVTVRGADGQLQLATRRLDQSQLTPLSGTEGAGSPFFSPDGQWIAFFADGKLKKIAVQGGAPVTLADAATFVRGPMSRFPTGSWGDDGNIVAMLNPTAGLSRVSSAGGQPAPLMGLTNRKGEIVNWPQVLPRNQAVLFTRLTGNIDYDSGNIEVFSLKSGARKTVLKGGFLGRYLPSGHLVYISQNTVFAAPFDLDRLATAGVPQPVLDIGGRLGCRNFDFSQTGSFVSCQPGNAQLSIFWLDSAGTGLPLQGATGSSYAGPRFSPDGKRLAFSTTVQGHQDIWVLHLDRGAASRLTALPGVNDTPVWTADGWNIIFRSADQPKPGIYGVRADGSGEAQRLLDLGTGDFPYSVSPDGKRLALWDSGIGGVIWTAPVESGRRSLSLGKAEPFLQAGRFNPALPGRSAPAFSPDSRWMAFCSNESGQLEVYVVPFPGPGGKWRISTGGGKFPIWSRNGRELFFLGLESNKIMVTSYKETADTFSAEKPRVWSEKRLLDMGVAYPYDLAPDGKRFAAILYADGTSEQKPVTNLTFLLNFFDELRRRVPAESK